MKRTVGEELMGEGMDYCGGGGGNEKFKSDHFDASSSAPEGDKRSASGNWQHNVTSPTTCPLAEHGRYVVTVTRMPLWDQNVYSPDHKNLPLWPYLSWRT